MFEITLMMILCGAAFGLGYLAVGPLGGIILLAALIVSFR